MRMCKCTYAEYEERGRDGGPRGGGRKGKKYKVSASSPDKPNEFACHTMGVLLARS